MRIPNWLQTELDSLGRKVLSGETSRDDAVALLTDEIFERDEVLVHDVTEDFSRKRLRDWVKSQLRTYYAEDVEENGPQQAELFPWLPRLLETSPGRFAHVNAMTGTDWDSALRQAEVKADNAASYAKAIKRAYDLVRPLLTEDKLTTADIADRLAL